ncbi:hypothetical protein J6590_031434 [Homalodisca vitripennis]|nr:hypothetical protein J6590_031434 [Homalodisca vitripennis]
MSDIMIAYSQIYLNDIKLSEIALNILCRGECTIGCWHNPEYPDTTESRLRTYRILISFLHCEQKLGDHLVSLPACIEKVTEDNRAGTVRRQFLTSRQLTCASASDERAQRSAANITNHTLPAPAINSCQSYRGRDHRDRTASRSAGQCRCYCSVRVIRLPKRLESRQRQVCMIRSRCHFHSGHH